MYTGHREDDTELKSTIKGRHYELTSPAMSWDLFSNQFQKIFRAKDFLKCDFRCEQGRKHRN